MNDRSRVPYEQPDEQIAALRVRIEELTQERDRLAHGETGVMRATGLEYEVRSLRDRLKMTSTAREILAEHCATIAEFEKRQAEAKLAAVVEAAKIVEAEAWYVLKGGDDPAERCQECGLAGVGELRSKLKALAAAREQPTQEKP
jgi:hypothetical protein